MARSKSVELVLDCTDVDKARIRLADGEFIQIEAGVPFKVEAKEVDFLLERSRLARYIKLTEGWSPKDAETRNDATRGTSDTTEPEETRSDETRGTTNQYVHAPETRDDATRGIIADTEFDSKTGVTRVKDVEEEVELPHIDVDQPEDESDPDEE